MIIVRRGNKELFIADEKLQSYLKEGFVPVDAAGNEILVGEKTTFEKLVEENAALKKEVASLKSALRGYESPTGANRQSQPKPTGTSNPPKKPNAGRK